MKRTITRNRPIATVIKDYVNKKSGKVTDARNEIQRRFFGLDWKDQKKIMAAFLDAGISDRNWAYSRLLDLWDVSFEPKVLELWNTYHEEKCGWVIIRHFPKEFISKHVNSFNEGRDYYFICRRLAADSDFVIDKERLSKTDYLMALSHADRHIGDEEHHSVEIKNKADMQVICEALQKKHPVLQTRLTVPQKRHPVPRKQAPVLQKTHPVPQKKHPVP